MAKDFIYNPGDVLHVEKNPYNNYGGEGNYLVIGHDTVNYYYHVLKLASEKVQACSLISIYFNVRDTEKIGEVDLKQLPLEELIKLAAEDSQGKCATADLEYLKDCGVLKQYVL